MSQTRDLSMAPTRTPGNDLISAEAAALLARVSTSTIWRRWRAGQISSSLHLGRRLFARADVEALTRPPEPVREPHR